MWSTFKNDKNYRKCWFCLIRIKYKIRFCSFEILFCNIWNFLILKNLFIDSALCCYYNKVSGEFKVSVHNGKNISAHTNILMIIK